MAPQPPAMQGGSSGTGRYCAGRTILHPELLSTDMLSTDVATLCLAHVRLQPVFRFVLERL
jgi:hypothetical protein